MSKELRVGISGWTYAPWRGVFYPRDLPQKNELRFASRQFNSIEINGTHYSLQSPAVFRKWKEQTPEKFVFSVKGSRYITHLRRLKDVEAPLANFFASGILVLGEKLGPILWQLPPSFRFEHKRIEKFFQLLPKTTNAAARIASRHDGQLKARAYLRPGKRRRLRHCLEVRHKSFMVPEFFDLLRAYHIVFVFADTAGKWPYGEDLTGDFVYIRLHGDQQLYVSGYGSEALDFWAHRIRLWRQGRQPLDAKLTTPRKAAKSGVRDVFVYFDNDVKVRAPADARSLFRLLDGE